MSYVGRPFSSARHSPTQLAAALRVAISTIGRIFVRHGILHRDLSRGNLLIAEGATFQRRRNPWAGLVDFDLAVNADAQQPSGAPERTGTPAYMAVNVLNPALLSVHCIWYDIESAFWVLYMQALACEPGESWRFDQVMLAVDLYNTFSQKTMLLGSLDELVASPHPPENQLLWALLSLLGRQLGLARVGGPSYGFLKENLPLEPGSPGPRQALLRPPPVGSPFAHTPPAVTAFINQMDRQVASISLDELGNPVIPEAEWQSTFPPSCADKSIARRTD
jgi:serine/threonine protein kinase